MRVSIIDHERALLHDIKSGKPVSPEYALLAVSGLGSREKIASYGEKIEGLFGRFASKCPDMLRYKGGKIPGYLQRSVARCLFEYLWSSKPYRFGRHFLLSDVVDAQLDPDLKRTIGTCVGLTSLYSVLGVRAGLELSILVSKDHLLNRFRVENRTVDIDNTDPQGFDCKTPGDFREFPLLSLTANVLNCRGLEKEKNGLFGSATADYEAAAGLNPEYANAWNNRANMLLRAGDARAALEDYTEAVRIDPRFCEAYCNRGLAKFRLGLVLEARGDFARALECDAKYGDALRWIEHCDRLAARAGEGPPFEQKIANEAMPAFGPSPAGLRLEPNGKNFA